MIVKGVVSELRLPDNGGDSGVVLAVINIVQEKRTGYISSMFRNFQIANDDGFKLGDPVEIEVRIGTGEEPTNGKE